MDECYLLTGTDLGCQNGGVCVNTLGSYRCNCKNGYSGTHCRQRNVTCDAAHSKDLCGFGTCINANNNYGYTCICDPGYTNSNMSPPTCVDVNECLNNTNPCHGKCTNLPGSFECGPCPLGYAGDGVNCFDINECAVDNGGCSLQPYVRCINTEVIKFFVY